MLVARRRRSPRQVVALVRFLRPHPSHRHFKIHSSLSSALLAIAAARESSPPPEKYWISDGEGRRRSRGGVELEAPPPAMATADRTRSFMKDVKRVIIKVTNESSDWRRRMDC